MRRLVLILLVVGCGPVPQSGGGGGGGPPPPPPPNTGGPGAPGSLPPGGSRFEQMPQQGWPALPGRAIGLLASQVGPWGAHIGWDPMLHSERGYGGDARYLFSSGRSAPWALYFESDQPIGMNHLEGWKVPLPGGGQGTYDADMLHPGAKNPFGLSQPAHLIEVEVNGGRGAAGNLHFVATSVEVLDGTTEYPIRAAQALVDARQRWEAFLAAQADAVTSQLEVAATAATGHMTGNVEERWFEGVSPTWLPDERRLQVRYVRWVLRSSEQRQPAPPPSCPPGAPCALDPDVVVHYGYGVELGLELEVDARGALAAERPQPPLPLHPVSVERSGLLGNDYR